MLWNFSLSYIGSVVHNGIIKFLSLSIFLMLKGSHTSVIINADTDVSLCSSKFYEKEAIMMDPVDGHILASLLGMYFVFMQRYKID